MANEYAPALTLLGGKIAEAKRKVNELVAAYNVLAEAAGQPPMSEGGGGSDGEGSGAGKAAGSVLIKNDTFFGRPQQTAIREFLAMRRSAGLGPATPREIFDALKTGGFQYEAKTDEIAMVGLRALLRKRYTVFQKLPNGTYGLTSWYPDAKKPKGLSPTNADQAGDLDDDAEADDAAAA